jgi:LysR family hydrogen peroxide-inducible transcriptional activator
MTISQLQYVLAVSTFKSFVKAAESCFVTQPTLSMQIQKLEEELNVKLFDRSKQPILLTDSGEIVVANARLIIQQAKTLNDELNSQKGIISGTLKVGIIPTVANYLIPLFLNDFIEKYKDIKLIIYEITTDEITEKIKNEQIDVAILATPLQENYLKETPLYYEPFVAYVNKKSNIAQKKIIEIDDLNLDKMWIIKEGHCWRNQVFNLCKNKDANTETFDYETGSLETLKKMVDVSGGFTLIPALALNDLSNQQLNKIRYFRDPEPVREISLITHRDYYKIALINILKECILNVIPEKMKIKPNSIVAIKNKV